MPTHLYIHKYINAKYSVWNRAGRDSYCSVLLRFSAAILINMSEWKFTSRIHSNDLESIHIWDSIYIYGFGNTAFADKEKMYLFAFVAI